MGERKGEIVVADQGCQVAHLDSPVPTLDVSQYVVEIDIYWWGGGNGAVQSSKHFCHQFGKAPFFPNLSSDMKILTKKREDGGFRNLNLLLIVFQKLAGKHIRWLLGYHSVSPAQSEKLVLAGG